MTKLFDEFVEQYIEHKIEKMFGGPLIPVSLLEDNVRIGRALIKLSAELEADGKPVPKYVRDALNPVSSVPNAQV